MKHQKIAAIVWTIDPDQNKRFLLRHNKPFNGYTDEWTVAFGSVEQDEALEAAATREVSEEYGIQTFEEIKNLDYKIEFEGKEGVTEIHFFAMKLPNIDIKIRLNEESIGFDWMKIEEINTVMKHEDEKKAFELI